MKDPKQFRERFKKWKEGTPIEEIYDNGRPTEYIEYMKRLAQPMAKNWEISEKEAYVHLLNDDSYDYYGWWKDGGKNIDPKTMEAAKPPLLPNDDGHFPDTYKTAKHPTFSNQSKYSGVVHPKYNPLGIHGGAWLGDTYLKGPMYLPGYSGGKDDRTYLYATEEPDALNVSSSDRNIQDAVNAYKDQYALSDSGKILNFMLPEVAISAPYAGRNKEIEALLDNPQALSAFTNRQKEFAGNVNQAMNQSASAIAPMFLGLTNPLSFSASIFGGTFVDEAAKQLGYQDWGDFITSSSAYNNNPIARMLAGFTNPGYLLGGIGAKQMNSYGRVVDPDYVHKKLYTSPQIDIRKKSYINPQTYWTTEENSFLGRSPIKIGKKYYVTPETKIGKNRYVAPSMSSQSFINPERIHVDEAADFKNTMSDVVNSDGTLNRGVISNILRQIYKDTDLQSQYGMSPTDIRNIYNYNSFGNPTNLKQHILDVVKTAKDSPVPKGYTKQEQVFAALAHDIGKIFGKANHGATSAQIVNKYFNVPEYVSDAISQHMTTKNRDTELLKSLQFADVARGLSYDQAAYKFPQLLYERELNIPAKYEKLPIRDELKNKINPWLRRQGYEGIPLNSTEEEAWQLLQDRIQQHLSFLRGVRDPKVPYTRSSGNRNFMKTSSFREDFRNQVGSEILAIKEGLKPDSDGRLIVSATNVPLYPTGSGRSGLFSVTNDIDRLPKHVQSRESKYLKINPDIQDAIYLSTGEDVANTYSTVSRDRPSKAFKVQIPTLERRPGETMSEYLQRNDFDMYDIDRILYNQNPAGVFNMFEGPYRLQTGRSLQSDMIKEDPNVPKLKFEKSGYDVVDPIIASDLYDDTASIINFIAEQVGMKSKISNKLKNGEYYEPHLFMEAAGDIQQLYNDILLRDGKNTKFIGVDDVNNYIASENYVREANMQYGDVFKDREDEPFLKRIGEKTEKLLSKKQRDLWNKPGMDPNQKLKYMNLENLIKKRLSLLYDDLKKAKSKIKIDKASLRERNRYLKNPDNMIRFMRQKGVSPRYELEGFNERQFITTAHGNSRTVTKNKPMKLTIGYMPGKKGERLLDIVEEVEHTDRHTTHRDRGDRAPESYKLSRKTLASLIPFASLLGLGDDQSYARGKDSGIYIKPSKRGTFTAAAKKRGMPVQSFASKVLNNPSNYSKAMRKKAQFAKNASKFKH